jgi:L-aminopeptidase/D-esterase-like protein
MKMQEISYKAAAFAAILFFGACVFTACSKDDDKEVLGVDAAVFTNASLSVADLQKVANIASTGMARCIRPVFTMADGDTVYAISLSGGDVQSDVNTIGVLASLVMEKAIADAILSSKITEEEYLANI